MGILQRIRTVLIPEVGVDLEPRDVVEVKINTDFSRCFAYLIGKGDKSGILLKCTSDGRLLVATAGGAFEVYGVENGIAADTFTTPNTYDQTEAQYVTNILVETNPAIVSFRDVNGLYGDEQRIPVGFTSLDLVHYGMKIRNRNLGNNAVYEFTIYR